MSSIKNIDEVVNKNYETVEQFHEPFLSMSDSEYINKLEIPLPEDSNWWKKPDKLRAQIVWNNLCLRGGWWGSGCPSQTELVALLLFEEGATLSQSSQIFMIKGMRYRFDTFVQNKNDFIEQLAGFTAFFNPHWDMELTMDDWDALMNPNTDIHEYVKLVEKVYETPSSTSDWKYIYWWSEHEVVEKKNAWDGESGKDYITVADETGSRFYFSGIPNIHSCAVRGVSCR